MYFERFHSPFFSAALAGAMLRAAASSRATASSAALTMFEVGALTTMTPAWVAAVTSTLSSPTPARATTLSLLRGGERLGVDLGRAAHEDRVDVGDGRQQLGAVGTVAVPDLEVRAQGLDRGRGELFGDEDDRLGRLSHEYLTNEGQSTRDAHHPIGGATLLSPYHLLNVHPETATRRWSNEPR